jgi:hypothetical protein
LDEAFDLQVGPQGDNPPHPGGDEG